MCAVNRGLLIVFEGIDRSGKTTQSTGLQAFLSTKTPTIHMRFPGLDRTTNTGKVINAYLQEQTNVEDHSIHLLFSANRWEAKDTLKHHLMEGTTVILDRYAYSGAAFTAAKGINLKWCKDPDRGLPKPDLVFYLELGVQDAMKRGNFGQERYEKEDFQIKVEKIFNELKENDWYIINAQKPQQEIALEIQRIVLQALKESREPLQDILWMAKE